MTSQSSDDTSGRTTALLLAFFVLVCIAVIVIVLVLRRRVRKRKAAHGGAAIEKGEGDPVGPKVAEANVIVQKESGVEKEVEPVEQEARLPAEEAKPQDGIAADTQPISKGVLTVRSARVRVLTSA